MSDASEKVIEKARKGTRHDKTREAQKRPSLGDVRGLTKDQLAAKFRTEMYNNALPQIPPIPGYHICWLSTTNKYDSIASREAMGYERVKPEEVPGMDHITVKNGNFCGCIGHEEMLLFKIPTDLWQQYMTIAHHDRPYEEEERVRDVTRYLKDVTTEGGSDIYLGDGTQELVNSRKSRVPTFNE